MGIVKEFYSVDFMGIDSWDLNIGWSRLKLQSKPLYVFCV